MSIPALNWVFRGAAPGLLRGAERHVLTCLADHATDDMIAWPGVHTIAAETGLSARSVQRALRALESAGYIGVDGPRGGGRASTRYRLIVIHISHMGDDTVSPQGRHGVTPGVTQRHPRGDTMSPEPPPTPHISINQPPGARGRAGGGGGGGLDDDHHDESALVWEDEVAGHRSAIIEAMRDLPTPLAQDVIDEVAGAIRAGVVIGNVRNYVSTLGDAARGGTLRDDRRRAVREARSRRDEISNGVRAANARGERAANERADQARADATAEVERRKSVGQAIPGHLLRAAGGLKSSSP